MFGTRVAVALLVVLPVSTPTSSVSTVLVSVSDRGGAANRSSAEPAVSGDGRYVAFTSHATNLVFGDRNNRMDVFVRDLRTRTTRLVSLGGNGRSHQPAISADGRYIAFVSEATNLVPGDTNGQPDVFVRDMRSGTVRRVSVGAYGTQANGDSAAPAISADGRYVAFASDAANLVPGDTNGTSDVFVRDLAAGRTERVSVSSAAGQSDDYADTASISADGRFVSFVSPATNLVRTDTNGLLDVFVRDRVTRRTVRVCVGTHGTQADGASSQAAISADGTHVVFVSQATNLVPGNPDAAAVVLIRDLVAGTTRRVSPPTNGDPGSYAAEPDVSATGRFVAFVATSPPQPGEPAGTVEVYRRDLSDGTISGRAANLASADPSISDAGGRIAFTSSATDLVPGDTNGYDDVFAWRA